MKRLAIVPFLILLAPLPPAVAQTTGQDGVQAQTDKCRAQTEQGGKQPAGTLTDKLGDCGGVLKPPATGDQEMTAPAPAQGKTPIIKPGDVPAQPPAK